MPGGGGACLLEKPGLSTTRSTSTSSVGSKHSMEPKNAYGILRGELDGWGKGYPQRGICGQGPMFLPKLAAGGSVLVRRGSLRGEPFSGNGHGPDPALGAGPPGVVLSLLIDVFLPSGAPSH